MINLKNILLVVLGSAAGGGLRYIISTVVHHNTTGKFPLGTFTVNMLGCFLMGLIVGLTDKNSSNQLSLVLLLATGFCGGFTTFSAFAYENITLFKNQLNLLALAYMLLSVVIGILAVRWGMSIVK